MAAYLIYSLAESYLSQICGFVKNFACNYIIKIVLVIITCMSWHLCIINKSLFFVFF